MESLVEIADRRSRKRAVLFAAATLIFLGVQLVTRPVFGGDMSGWRLYAWPFNVAILLACLGTGGGLLNSTAIRALINDEVARSNYRTACVAGFWIAMIAGIVLFVVPAFASFSAREAAYLAVTASAASALLTFSWLEYRAHADA